MKKLYEFFEPGTPEYVVLHAYYRVMRGKRPTVSFCEILNPRAALVAATKDLYKCDQGLVVLSDRVEDISAVDLCRIWQVLGVYPVSLNDFVRSLLKEQQDDHYPREFPFMFRLEGTNQLKIELHTWSFGIPAPGFDKSLIFSPVRSA